MSACSLARSVRKAAAGAAAVFGPLLRTQLSVRAGDVAALRSLIDLSITCARSELSLTSPAVGGWLLWPHLLECFSFLFVHIFLAQKSYQQVVLYAVLSYLN